MKLKTLLFITPILTISLSVFAKPMLSDSVGIENMDGKKVILHKLDPKDNYYSVGRRYNVKPATIIQFNNDAPLKIGNIIKVPTDRPFLETTKTVNTQQNKPAAPPIVAPQQTQVQKPVADAQDDTPVQQYKISAGETLYSVAKRFDSTVEDITKLNGLTSTTVIPGQVVKVKAGSANVPPPAPVVVATPRPIAKRDSTTYATAQDSANRHFNNPNRYGLFEKNEKGVATWIDDTSLDPNKKLVLHRTAPVGTVIKITNPMTNRTTFAKVVGGFTDNETTKDVIIIMTKNVAESIGALDKRIHVNISYGSPNE